MNLPNFLNKIKKTSTASFILFGMTVIILVGILVFSPQPVYANELSWAQVALGPGAMGLGLMGIDVFAGLAKGTGQFLIMISGWFLTLAGTLFDYVVEFTIIDMAEKVGSSEGLGDSISVAWGALRDIANMLFIFVLLYVAFKSMFELDFGSVGKSVKNIIIVALLINFSLFFSKVVIDASNIVSVGFYNSIITANSRSVTGESAVTGKQTISTGYMHMLGLQKWHDSKILEKTKITDPKQILLFGVLSSIFILITAVVLLISGVMLLTRFIILIFLMILSPLALIAIIIPGQNGYFNKWKDALIDQSFFAPVFFALTWVVFKIGSTPGFIVGGTTIMAQGASYVDLMSEAPKGDSLALVLNFVLIIGFMIAALVISKQMATRTAGFSAISGGLGTGLIGGAAFAGRQTLGRASKLVSETQREKWSKSGIGRAGLWMANKGATGSFDTRAIDTLKKVPGLGKEMDLFGKAGGSGGFSKAVEEKAKARAKYAKDVYGQTDDEKEAYEKAKKAEEGDVVDAEGNIIRKGIRTRRIDAAERTRAEADTAENAAKTHMNNKLSDTKATYETLKRQKVEAERRGASKEEIKGLVDRMANERAIMGEIIKDTEENDADYKKLKKTANETREAAQEAEKQRKKKDIDDEEYSVETQAINKAGEERQKAYAKKVAEESPISTTAGATGGIGAGAAIGGTIGAIAGPIGAAVGVATGAALGGALGTALGNKIGGMAPFSWAGNKAAAREINKQAKGKSKAEKLADAAKDYQQEQDKNATGGATPASATPSTPPPATGGTTPAP